MSMIFENKRRQAVINISKNILAIIFVLSVVFVAVFLTQGWTITPKGNPHQTGLVQFISTPNNANVKINGTQINDTTNTKRQLDPNVYNFEISKKDYTTWRRTAQVDAGKILWLNYARLLPEKLTSKKFFNFEKIQDIIFSADKKWSIIVAQNGGSFKIYKINLEEENQQLTEIILPDSIFNIEDNPEIETQKQQVISTISFKKISENGSRILAQWKKGKETQNLIIDTQNPEKSTNLTEIFHLNFENITPANRDFTRLYSTISGDLREINLDNSTVSANITTGVLDLKIHNNDSILVSRKIKDGDFTVEVLDKNGKKTTIKKSITHTPKIEMGRYYNENYVHILTDNILTIYKGSDWRGAYSPKIYKTFTLKFTPSNIELNQENRMILLSSPEKNQIIDLETIKSYNLTSSKKYWVDNFILYSIENGKIIWEDFDGSNKRVVVESENFKSSISANDKFLFSVAKNSNGTFSLNKSRIILD